MYHPLTPNTSSFLHIDHRINPLLCFSTVCAICWLQRKRRPPSSPCLEIWTQNTLLANVWPTQHGRSKTLQSLTRFRHDSMRWGSTRFSPDGDSHRVIDVYATNHPDLVTAINVSDPISDHCMVTTHLREPRTQHKHKRNESSSSDGSFPSKIVPDFRNVDWHGLRAHLLTSPLLEAIQGTDNVNCAAAVWESMFVKILQRHIPNRYIRHRLKNKVWMTSKLHRLSKTKFRLFKKARASRSPQDWTTYCQYRNFCTSEFHAAKSAYLHRKHEEIASATDGSHRWWTLAKQLAKISTPHLAIPELRADEDVATTDFEKATLLAKYFASQCTSTAPQEHLKGAPFPLPEKQPTFDFLPITELTVLRTLQHLPISKAMAHPLIINQVLRECAPIICPSITHLFNLSITTGVFPDAWKRATVTPIFKNRGTAGDPSNYRPVSLLPAMGKVLDRIQSSCLLQRLVRHNLISPHQFGFIPGKSTTMQLVYLIHRWLQALEKVTTSQQSFWISRRPLTAFGITDYCTSCWHAEFHPRASPGYQAT